MRFRKNEQGQWVASAWDGLISAVCTLEYRSEFAGESRWSWYVMFEGEVVESGVTPYLSFAKRFATNTVKVLTS